MKEVRKCQKGCEGAEARMLLLRAPWPPSVTKVG